MNMGVCEGLLPVYKPAGKTAFHLVALLRKLTGVRTIGHAGTLDPFATGVMILLIGKPFTRQSDSFLNQDKEYVTTVHLGVTTDSYDIDGQVVAESGFVPTLRQVEDVLTKFQGTVLQTPPMFSAKKVGGKKLYTLARKGISIERQPVPVTLQIELIEYAYPSITLKVNCSKGTYIRSLAYDIGLELTCGAHLSALARTRSGAWTLNDCCEGARLMETGYDWKRFLRTDVRATNYRSG